MSKRQVRLAGDYPGGVSTPAGPLRTTPPIITNPVDYGPFSEPDAVGVLIHHKVGVAEAGKNVTFRIVGVDPWGVKYIVASSSAQSVATLGAQVEIYFGLLGTAGYQQNIAAALPHTFYVRLDTDSVPDTGTYQWFLGLDFIDI